MSTRWAIRMPVDRADAAAALRLLPGVEACDANGELWLRGRDADEAIEQMIRMLPAIGRYTVLEDDLVTPTGNRVPTGRLPKGPWNPIAMRFEPAAPTAALPGEPQVNLDGVPGLTLTLAPSESPLPTNILITDWRFFFAWAQTAPEVRLRPLTFALTEDGRAIVRGTPLPPIAGRHHVETNGLVLPAGRRLEPAIDPEAAIQMLRGRRGNSHGDELFLFADDSSYECLPVALLIPASHRAVRLMEAQRRA